MMRSPVLGNVNAFRDVFDRLVNETLGETWQTLWSRDDANGSRFYSIPLDVYSTDDQAVVLAAIPGMNPDDLEISLYQNTLVLSGSLKSVADAEEAKGATWYVSELGSGTYRRSVTLPFPVDAEHVRATFDRGVVRIELPKAEHAKPRRIEISGQKDQKETKPLEANVKTSV